MTMRNILPLAGLIVIAIAVALRHRARPAIAPRAAQGEDMLDVSEEAFPYSFHHPSADVEPPLEDRPQAVDEWRSQPEYTR